MTTYTLGQLNCWGPLDSSEAYCPKAGNSRGAAGQRRAFSAQIHPHWRADRQLDVLLSADSRIQSGRGDRRPPFAGDRRNPAAALSAPDTPDRLHLSANVLREYLTCPQL